MNLFVTVLIAVGLIGAQGHDQPPAEALKNLAFMRGEWKGKQEFDTGGAPMTGEVVMKMSEAIGGRYLEESLSVTLPGRKPSDTRHFLMYDAKAKLYKAWWFNDSANGAMELQGTLDGDKLVMTSKPTETGAGPGAVFRVTYRKVGDRQLEYSLELKEGDAWRRLFKTTYTRQA